MTRVRRAVARLVVGGLILATVQVCAQQSTQLTSAEWRALVEQLPPQQFVSIRLTDGTTIKGTLITFGPSGFTVQPRTRVPVASRTIGYDQVVSLERKRRPWSAGRKAATIVGVSAGVLLLLAVAAVSAMDGALF